MSRACIPTLILLLCLGCSRGGLSRKFRSAAEKAVQALRIAGETRSEEAVSAADAAVENAHKQIQTGNDMKTSDVLDWYSILVHRYDLQRTANWRKLCDAEVELYLQGKNQGSAEQWNGYKYEPVAVARGACEQAVYQMMKQDCDELVAKGSVKRSDCSLLETPDGNSAAGQTATR